tara:strand:- start:2482 stop:2913 length:432 start_codon:yes stop_codon:yes gene_type:complete
MSNVIVQEFYVTVEGRGYFAIELSSNGESVFVPTFGFNKDGEVLPRKKHDELVSPEKEWIDKQIGFAVANFRKKQFRKAINDGQNHVFEPEYKRDAIPEDVAVYAALVRRSDCPNEIGIVVDESPMGIGDSAIFVTEDKYNLV